MTSALDPQWRAEVIAWVDDRLAEHGIVATGDLVESETRAWSTVWHRATDHGRVWFKQVEPAGRAESAVHTALARIAPTYVDAPLGGDVELGWLLTADGGATLAAAAPDGTRGVESATLPRWLADYAALQRATVGHDDVLRRSGLRFQPPSAAAAEAVAQAERLHAYPVDDPRHLDGDGVRSVVAAVPALETAAALLSAGPVPLAFDHGDLFPRNVFVPRRPGAAYRFFDVAEASWAHPFSSLVMLIPELLHRWQLTSAAGAIDAREPRVRAALHAYLTAWTDLAPLAELRPLLAAALRIGALHRSGAWLRTLADAPPEVVARHGTTPWAWLQDVTLPVLL